MTYAALAEATVLPATITWRWMARTPEEHSGPGRVGKLRNYGVQLADSTWIAFLDDDNEWTKDHLDGLLCRANETGSRAVHSQRMLLNRDGTPYLEARMPWAHDPQEGQRRYQTLYTKGVVSPGSCIMRDRVDPFDHPDPVQSVDTSEWLLMRELLLEVPFHTDFTALDECEAYGEDDYLLADLITRRELIACSNRPSLLYYLGGFSNNFVEAYDSTFVWR